jgi:photosystem II stability/assembly factor-like uncharacterized protein
MFVSCSANGQTMLAASDAVNCLSVLISRDFGMSWAPGQWGCWDSIACSSDGRAMLGTSGHGYNGPILFSTDGGFNWTNATTPEVNGIAVAVSADGTKMASVGRNTPIFSSHDSGVTWTQDNAPVTNWFAISCSADGSKLVAAVNGGGIYTWHATPAPKLRATFSTDSILMSWVLPSINFVVQQSPTLAPGQWTNLAATPLLNYTNLLYEVTVPKPVETMFYRLDSQ